MALDGSDSSRNCECGVLEIMNVAYSKLLCHNALNLLDLPPQVLLISFFIREGSREQQRQQSKINHVRDKSVIKEQ